MKWKGFPSSSINLASVVYLLALLSAVSVSGCAKPEMSAASPDASEASAREDFADEQLAAESANSYGSANTSDSGNSGSFGGLSTEEPGRKQGQEAQEYASGASDGDHYISRTREPITLGPTAPTVPLPAELPSATPSLPSRIEPNAASAPELETEASIEFDTGVETEDYSHWFREDTNRGGGVDFSASVDSRASIDSSASVGSSASVDEPSSLAANSPQRAESLPDGGSSPLAAGQADSESLDSQTAAITTHADGSKSVDVFFATDRAPTSQVVPTMFRTFLPALGVACICWAMFIGLSVARRFQIYWVMGAGLATCMGVMVLHVCILRWQEYSRLSNSASTRFSVFRFEPEVSTDYPLHVGLAEVSVPASHVSGGFERPSLLKLEFTESADKHIVLQSVEVEEFAEDWFAKLSDRVRYASDREGFLFIHGYNVKFGDAVKRTAQLAVDLDVQGPVISYSWPSRGQVALYSADEASVAWSVPNFEKLLVDLRTFTELRKVNIVAHSMGNRALLESIERIHLRSGVEDGYETAEKMIGAMILAAPDVDAQTFRSRYVDAIESVADRATIYFTNDDFALRLSQAIHSAPRLGLGELPTEGTIEGIDTGPGGLFTLGHSYYGSDPVVLDDMRRVLNLRQRAPLRGYLQECITQTGSRYWKLDRALHASLSTTPIR